MLSRDEINARRRDKAMNDPEYREKLSLKAKEKYVKNKEAILQDRKRYYYKNRGKVLNRLRHRKQALVEKAGGACVDCGERRPFCLHFHHRDPSTKLATISQMISSTKKYPPEVLQAEIDKCDLVCGNCHAKRHSAWDYLINGEPRRKGDSQLALKFRRKVYALKIAGKSECDCGETHLSALAFHHLDPRLKKTKINVETLQLSGDRFAQVIAEIEKCDVVCCNCHAAIHHYRDFVDG